MTIIALIILKLYLGSAFDLPFMLLTIKHIYLSSKIYIICSKNIRGVLQTLESSYHLKNRLKYFIAYF